MKKVCSNCRHWKKREEITEDPYCFDDIRDGFRICCRQNNENHDDIMLPVWKEFDCAELKVAISTGPNFSCKHHLTK